MLWILMMWWWSSPLILGGQGPLRWAKIPLEMLLEIRRRLESL